MNKNANSADVRRLTRVLYMSFDKFPLSVESYDLSQADKSIIRVSSFPKLTLQTHPCNENRIPAIITGYLEM